MPTVGQFNFFLYGSYFILNLFIGSSNTQNSSEFYFLELFLKVAENMKRRSVFLRLAESNPQRDGQKSPALMSPVPEFRCD